MALPSPKFYTSTGLEITTHDFGSVEAGAYKPGSTGWSFRLYNDYGGSLGSDTMTSVKVSIRDDDGGTDETWVQQHWVQIKSNGGSTGLTDDAQTVFTAVGKNKELSLGNIPSGEYRTLLARCYPPTDAEENASIEFQLRATFQQPATSICKWITGLRGNGVVATTGEPFAMSTTGGTDPIPYTAGYALIDNNEIYYGSSGTYDITTTGSNTYSIYLSESGAFGETTGSVAANQLKLYEATISSGVCTALTDKRVYLAGLQSGTTGAMSSTPDKGDIYLDITNGIIYGAKTSTGWTQLNSTGGWPTTFLGLTDTPSDYSGDASKILRVTTGSGAVEFISSTGINHNDFGGLDVGDYQHLTAIELASATNVATTGVNGLLLALSGTTGEFLSATGGWAVPAGSTAGGVSTFLGLTDTPADYTDDADKLLRVNSSSDSVEFVSSTSFALDSFGTPTDIATNNATTGYHGLLLKLGGGATNYLRADGTWATPAGSSGGGEVNTASNAGTTGIGIYYQKTTYDLEFKAIHSTGNILVTDSTGTHTVNLDVDSTGIKLDDLGTPDNNTDLNATTGHHGLLPILSGSSGEFLNGNGGFTTPAGGATTTLFHETFMDVRAANSSGIHAAIAGSTASEQTITTNITNPDVPRNASITITQNATPTGDITLYGTFTDGTTGNEAITSTTGTAAIYGNKAFAKVSQFKIPITISSGDTVSVGWSDKIGLCNTVSTGSSVFKLKKNAADTSTGISGNVDATYNTLNLATITDYDDYEIWYKS